MQKLEKIQLLKNVGSSWFSLGVNILVGLFLSPYILHRLGDTAFGIWILIFSLTGYYGIFDFGIRSSIIRYVSKFAATKNIEEASELINTALLAYTGIGVLTFTITVVGSIYIDRLFQIPPGFQSTARWLFLVVGSSVALTFPLGVFGGILEGLQKFYLINWTNIFFSGMLRPILIIVFLRRGYGLLTVALITVGLPIIASIVRGALALRALPLRFSPAYISRGAVRQIANYSGVTFVIIVASRLKSKTDPVIIGSFLSPAAITYFYAGSRLLDYASEVVSSLAQIFVPMSSQSEAMGDQDRLRKIFVAGNRACALITLPMTAAFVIVGRSIIEVWLGKRYVAQGYSVLLTLIIPYTLMLTQFASGRVLYGMSKHGKVAIITVIEAAANIILSILLVRPFGIVGDAIGTAIPLAATYTLFMPFHLCSLLGIRMSSFLRQAFLLPLALALPPAMILLLMQRWLVPHTYRQLGLQLLIVGGIYAALLAWAHSAGKLLRVGNLALAGDSTAAEAIPLPVIETYSED